MKILLLATIASSIVLASCTQANADGEFQQPQILHNQGCYAQIDEFKAENGEPDSYKFQDYEHNTIIWLRYPDGQHSFVHDRLVDVCNTSHNYY